METRKLADGDFTLPRREKTQHELLQEVRQFCARITYKPGWVLTVTAPEPRIHKPWHVVVNLDYTVPSIHNPYMMQPLTTGFSIAEHSLVEMLARGDFMNFIKVNLFRRAELHELDEWLKLDGVCVTEPHPELQNWKMSIDANLKDGWNESR